MTGFPLDDVLRDKMLRLEAELLDNPDITDRNWGIEAALDLIVAGKLTDPLTIDADVERTIATVQRRERHRAMLRRSHVAEVEDDMQVEAAAVARVELQSIKKKVSPPNWRLLVSVAAGHDYGALAAAEGTTLGALRARVFRLRRDAAA